MKEIIAKEGHYLTQIGEVENRIYVTRIKGIGINEADWREASQEEKDAWEKAQQEAELATNVA